MTWTLDIAGRVAVVTGAAGGIGREVAKALARAGVAVAAVDRDLEACEEVVASLEGSDHLALAADLLDLRGHDELLDRVEATFGRLDILVHLAAVLRRRGSIEEITEEDWDAQIDLNLKASFFLNRAAARRFLANGRGGRIINFASQGWWSGGYGGSIVYAASKGGLVSMTRGFARELAPAGITANTIAPGGVETAMMRSGSSDEDISAFVEMIPAGRLADPSEIAGAVLFLASDHASFITGATINISGGQLMY